MKLATLVGTVFLALGCNIPEDNVERAREAYLDSCVECDSDIDAESYERSIEYIRVAKLQVRQDEALYIDVKFLEEQMVRKEADKLNFDLVLEQMMMRHYD